jgi:hypothetical protein
MPQSSGMFPPDALQGFQESFDLFHFAHHHVPKTGTPKFPIRAQKTQEVPFFSHKGRCQDIPIPFHGTSPAATLVMQADSAENGKTYYYYRKGIKIC